MLELYGLLAGIVDPICSCFVDHYPETEEKVYPYAEIKFPNIVPNNSFSDNNLLSVSIWNDKGSDIQEIETITDAVHKALDRLRHNDTAIQITVNRNTPFRLSLDDPEMHIQRRELRYVVKVYYK